MGIWFTQTWDSLATQLQRLLTIHDNCHKAINGKGHHIPSYRMYHPFFRIPTVNTLLTSASWSLSDKVLSNITPLLYVPGASCSRWLKDKPQGFFYQFLLLIHVTTLLLVDNIQFQQYTPNQVLKYLNIPSSSTSRLNWCNQTETTEWGLGGWQHWYKECHIRSLDATLFWLVVFLCWSNNSQG